MQFIPKEEAEPMLSLTTVLPVTSSSAVAVTVSEGAAVEYSLTTLIFHPRYLC